MQETLDTTQTGDPAWQEREEPKPHDLFASIAAIERAHTAPRQRAAAILDEVFDAFTCLSACLTVGISNDEIDLQRESQAEGVAAWTSTLQTTALEARSHSRSIARLFGPDGSPCYAVIASPIDTAGRDPFGAIAVLVHCSTTAQAERLQLHLRAACLQIAPVLTRQPKARPEVEMSDIARVYIRAGQFKNIHEFSYTITNAIRQRFDCDQAAIGIVRNGKLRVTCISGLDEVKRRSPGVHQIEQAMGECADAGCPVLAQPRDRWEDANVASEGLLHQRWRAAAAGACVLSIPVDTGDGPTAIVSFRRPAEQPFDADDIEAARKLLAPLSGAIPLVTRSTQPLPTHAIQTARKAIAWGLQKGALRRKVFILLAITGATWATLGSRPYHVAVPAVVIADREQIIAAPIEGPVTAVQVRAGDHVQAGQPLVFMDTSLLTLQQEELQAEIRNADLRIAEAVANTNPAAAALAQGERRSLRARLDRVLDQFNDATVLAPIDGVVIAPDLDNLPGRTLAVGDPMLSIAASESLTLELRVPQSRVTDLTTGSKVRFASHARPESPGYTSLGSVAPATVHRDGSAVFIAKATLPTDQAWLRPGMEGVAMIDAGDRPNWWLALHRIIDNARLRFWLD